MPRPQASFGARLRALRLHRELSQVELARRIGRHQTAIGPYERDEYAPPPAIVERLAEILDTSPEFLLFGREPGRTSLPLLGRVGPGGLFAGTAGGTAGGTPPRPLRLADDRLAALVIDDDSMAPVLRPGQIALLVAAAREPARLIGRDALVELADGRSFLRRLLPGVTAGRYDLAAYAAPTMRDVAAVAAQPVVGVLWAAALQAEGEAA
jgi:DNA-binding XRE family transcriptional regulator